MGTGRLLNAAALAIVIAAPARADAAPTVGPPAATRPATAASKAPPAIPELAVARGPQAILAANRGAVARSRADRFVEGLQVFAYAPGRIYEVWTAPLRVTVLTLGSGETVIALAAGDTVRWQIGETTSGLGDGRRTHVLIKPLERQLETNLVLTTNQRLYLLRLRSGDPDAYNPAVAWAADALAPNPAPPAAAPPAPAPAAADAVIAGRLDARYRIAARGRKPIWTPTAVMTDGTRTLIAFPAALTNGEAPALFAVAPDGQAQMVNYRQQPGLYIVDQVLDRAELRLGGGRKAVVVTLTHLDGERS